MRKTIYVTLAALGAASIATAAVMTSDAPERRVERTAQVQRSEKTGDETRATAGESSERATEKKDCERRCWFFD